MAQLHGRGAKTPAPVLQPVNPISQIITRTHINPSAIMSIMFFRHFAKAEAEAKYPGSSTAPLGFVDKKYCGENGWLKDEVDGTPHPEPEWLAHGFYLIGIGAGRGDHHPAKQYPGDCEATRVAKDLGVFGTDPSLWREEPDEKGQTRKMGLLYSVLISDTEGGDARDGLFIAIKDVSGFLAPGDEAVYNIGETLLRAAYEVERTAPPETSRTDRLKLDRILDVIAAWGEASGDFKAWGDYVIGTVKAAQEHKQRLFELAAAELKEGAEIAVIHRAFFRNRMNVFNLVVCTSDNSAALNAARATPPKGLGATVVVKFTKGGNAFVDFNKALLSCLGKNAIRKEVIIKQLRWREIAIVSTPLAEKLSDFKDFLQAPGNLAQALEDFPEVRKNLSEAELQTLLECDVWYLHDAWVMNGSESSTVRATRITVGAIVAVVMNEARRAFRAQFGETR